jgi:hypothetical protein
VRAFFKKLYDLTEVVENSNISSLSTQGYRGSFYDDTLVLTFSGILSDLVCSGTQDSLSVIGNLSIRRNLRMNLC